MGTQSFDLLLEEMICKKELKPFISKIVELKIAVIGRESTNN